MAKNLKPQDLAAALEEELTTYHQSVIERLNACSQAAVKKLVSLTKSTAPVGTRGSFRKNITSKRVAATNRGDTFAWYVKGPDARLTHLLVKGHATKDGGRTKADPFLQNAMDSVLPEYEQEVKEAVEG